MTKRIDRLKDGTWVEKDELYRTVKKAKYLEDKLEMVRRILNERLKEK